LFCNIIDISGVNAYVLWLEIQPSWNSNKLFRRRLFLETLGTLLVNDEIIRKLLLLRGNALRLLVNDTRDNVLSSESNAGKPKLSSGAKCHIRVKKDRKAYSACNKCKKYLCGEHKITAYFCKDC